MAIAPTLIRLRIPGPTGAGGAVTFWDATKDDYKENDKVSYFGEIFNVDVAPVPVGTLPTDTNYFRQITSIGGGGGNLPSGGDVEEILVKNSPVDGDASWVLGAVSHWNATISDYSSLTTPLPIVSYQGDLYFPSAETIPVGTLPTDIAYFSNLINTRVSPVPITFWDADKSDYSVNDKVSYLDKLYNVHTSPVPIGTLPTDTTYWAVLGGDFNPVITNPSDNQVINYNNISGEWENGDVDAKVVEVEITSGASRYQNPDVDFQDELNSELVSSGGGTYYFDDVDVNLYEPVFSSRILRSEPDQFTYTEIGTLKSVSGGNENGSFHIELEGFLDTLSEGDAVYITNTPPTNDEPEDNSDTYVVVSSDNASEFIVNKPILKGVSGYPDSDNFKAYRFTYVQVRVYNDDYVTTTGQGYAGYPLPFGIYQPGQKIRATKLGNQTLWSADRQQDRPNYYGLESDPATKQRPTNLWSKGAADDTVVAEGYPYIYDGLRQNFVGIPNNRAVVLQNHPVQNVFIATNQENYSLSDYPNSYVIKNYPVTNFNGSSYDLVVLFGGVGTDPQFSQRPEFQPACKVCMDAGGVIQTVQDTVWVLDNGGFETKSAAIPEVLSGLDVVDNGLSPAPLATQYTLTDSSVVTGYLEQVETIYPDNISVTDLWEDGDDRRYSVLRRDGRWYDESAVIPDPNETNPKHALIPFGSFSVDFLYVYEKNGSYYDYLVVKGNTLYNAFDLVEGIPILPIRETARNGYIPVSALVQLGSGNRGYHNTFDIKGKDSGDRISITTQEFLEDLSAKAQFRTESNTVNIAQYSPVLQEGVPEPQGWSVTSSGSDTLEPQIDPFDGGSSLYINQVGNTLQFIEREPLRERLERLYEFGGQRNFTVRPLSDSVKAGEVGMRVLANDDPRATQTVFFTPPNNGSGSIPTTYALHDQGGVTVKGDGGYIEWTHKNASPNSGGAIFNSSDNSFQLKIQYADFLVLVIDGVEINANQWALDQNDVGKVIRVQRVGNVVEFYKDNVKIAQNTLGSAPDWVIDRLFANEILELDSRSLAISDLSFKESTSSNVKTYQMRTKLNRFEPNVPSDGNFDIISYNPSDWKADITEPGIAEQAFRLQWETDNSTFTEFDLLSDAGNQSLTFAEVGGYFSVKIKHYPQNSGSWGLVDITIIPPSGEENAQSLLGVDWNYSGYTAFDLASWLRVGSNVELGTGGQEFYLRDYEEVTFTASSTINLTAQDFALGNIFFIEGDRDWNIVVPPVTDQLEDLNTPNNSTVELYFVGDGSYRVKRPDLSDDILIERSDGVQYSYVNYTQATITCRDDFTSLGYVQYRVADLLQGDSAIIVPPPTAAEDVTFDPTGLPISGTNVQSAIAELSVRAGTVDEPINVTAVAGTVINLTTLTIPTDYTINPTIVLEMNGQALHKGTEWTRNSSTSFRVTNLDLVAGEDLGLYKILPE